MKIITMSELRRNAHAIVLDLRRGLAMTLTYRGRPLARLEPIGSTPEGIAADDPLYRSAEQAGRASGNSKEAKANAQFTNADIDHTLYGG